jgi:hypothetical protein
VYKIYLINFFSQPSIFAKRVKLDDLQLPAEGVYVVWKWDISEDVSESEELDSSKEVESEDNEREETESDSDHEAVAAIRGTHTVTFKCIGATKTPESQTALKTVNY